MRVFTPFWKRVPALGDPPNRCRRRRRCALYRGIASEALEDWQLEPTKPDWAGGLRETWTPGEAARAGRLEAIPRRRVAATPTHRDRPDREGTSRLSPHLRFGEISPRQVWHAARFAAAEQPRLAGDMTNSCSELGWREFSIICCSTVPDLAERQPAARVRRLSLANDDARRCGPGSAARPAIRSSMPACASSGTPAGCTTACGWSSPRF